MLAQLEALDYILPIFLAINQAGDRHIAILARLGGQGEEMQGKLLERLALLFIGIFVNIDVIEVPLAERFEHALVLRALDELRPRQSFQRNFAVMAARD